VSFDDLGEAKRMREVARGVSGATDHVINRP